MWMKVTRVHLLDEDLHRPDFTTPGGNKGATQPTETHRDAGRPGGSFPSNSEGNSITPRFAEVA
jgi:hypothetical protein